jgi:hypothetical protein
VSAAARQFLLQGFGHEGAEGLAAFSGRRLGAPEQLIRDLNRGLH